MASPREFSPWFWGAVFGLLTVSNYGLGYIAFSVQTKLWILLLGVLLPLLLWSRNKKKPLDPTPFFQREFLPDFPLWTWFLLGSAALLVRLWRVDSLMVWPMGDEGLFGLTGIELSQKWEWRFFHTAGQAPPVLFWIYGLAFRFSKSVFLNLWGPSAVISFLAVITGYMAARQFFSKSFSFLCCGFMAFTYWPLYTGRLAAQGVMVLFWWPFVLYCLGKYLRADSRSKPVWALGLGAANGLNSFTFTSWPIFAGAVGLTVFIEWWNRQKRNPGILFRFALGFLAGLVPFLWGVSQSGFGQHVLEVSLWNAPGDWRRQIGVVVNYLSVLGWGPLHGDNYFAPLEGGFLNPLLTSFFCLGLVEVVRHRSLALARWLMGFGVLFMMPGFLSSNMEGLRIIQVLPLLLVVAAWGCRAVLEPFSLRVRMGFVLLLFAFTLVFDGGRLMKPYLDVDRHPGLFQKTTRSLARFRAYRYLADQEKREGPGYILCEWDLPADRTLTLGTYFFNAAFNPRLEQVPVKWLAVLTDAHYRPFLERRFPQGQWKDLDSDFSKDGNRDLVILPVTDETRPVFTRWAKADKAFQDINWAVDHIHDKDCLEKTDLAIREDYPLVQGDPYLESCFWEKTAQFYYYYRGHFPEHLRASEWAVQRGYPAAHLLAKWAELVLLSGDRPKAEKIMLKAKESEALYPWR